MIGVWVPLQSEEVVKERVLDISELIIEKCLTQRPNIIALCQTVLIQICKKNNFM